ncbi:actin-like ATPase domain-containing protein [Cylindrobasidium torrendii FP15055 ss-10]|uniref:Xylulose kinase n=1 Tax=Cylindrobasidium torrendii FP15055 ss-10 TaxID=1314674 RepID=A0A0D7BMS6_9AGAR|nr:actin-like ATPase domain-containing protein [Cylindrobasidium torrendii FP15055 ss-10]
MIENPTFLGLDLSTQQLKAVLVQEDCSIVHESAVRFEEDLPKYGTTKGAHKGPDGVVTSPVAMWLDALDLLMEKMRKAGVDFASIAAISGAGQQHGSVYWSNAAEECLQALDASKPLTQLAPAAFSLQTSPIWQDSSTTRECREIEEAIGGAQALADISGSRAYERFTGTQIKKLRRVNRAAYDSTSRVSLVSSWIPSIFLGTVAPIEISDASGMNLMDVISCKWDDRLLEICGGPELRSKLGPEPVPGGTSLGTVCAWWVERWGFSPECIVAPFTGDNPASVAALSLPGDALLSLGTSTTYLLSIPPASEAPKRFTTSHLLSHPTTAPDAQIAMLCYKNGALAREQVRDRFADADWSKYNDAVEQTHPGSEKYMGLYFPLPEIIPPGVKGSFVYRTEMGKKPVKVEEKDVPTHLHPRMILESQFLSIRSRIAAILPPNSPPLQRLVVTGGSSANQTIRQLAADLFDMKVYVSATKEAAGMGGALLARYAWWRATEDDMGTFEEMCAGLGSEALGMKCVAEPNHAAALEYAQLVEPYVACEAEVVRECNAHLP